MVGDNGKPVFPDQLLQAGHFVRFTAEVDLPVDDTSPIEILTQRSAMRTAIGCKNQDRIERGHPSHPTVPRFEYLVLSFEFRPPTRYSPAGLYGNSEFRIPNSEFS